MPLNFAELSLSQVKQRIPDSNEAWFTANAAFIAGDHWQDTNGWIGPLVSSTHSQYSMMLLQIKRAFISKNAIKEVVERHMSGVIGHEPAWSLTVRRPLAEGEEPTTEEQALIDEAEALLTGWWDERGAHQVVQDAVKSLLWSKRGPLRLFVPPGELIERDDGTRIIPQGTLDESIDRIWLHHPDADQAAVIVDKRTMRSAGLYIYEEDDDELTDDKEHAEIVFLNDAGLTVIKIAGLETSEAVELDFGGRLTMYEMERDRLITDQIQQNQRLLNLALTMLQRNVELGGFLERVFLNAQLPGRTEIDSGGNETFIPEPLYLGAGASNFIQGTEIEDEDGNITYASPQALRFDPVPIQTFTGTKLESYQNILEEAQQAHAIISGDATASGESRIQARTDFRQSLMPTKTQADKAIRWLLETVLAMTATFAGQTGRYDELRANVDCKIDLGPLSADEKRVEKELTEGDPPIQSVQTARMKIGIDDPDAEAQQVATEQDAAGQRRQQTLATAVLQAQRGLNAGQQTNGLEQPADTGTA